MEVAKIISLALNNYDNDTKLNEAKERFTHSHLNIHYIINRYTHWRKMIMSKVHVFDHPLIQHKLSYIRDAHWNKRV